MSQFIRHDFTLLCRIITEGANVTILSHKDADALGSWSKILWDYSVGETLLACLEQGSQVAMHVVVMHILYAYSIPAFVPENVSAGFVDAADHA